MSCQRFLLREPGTLVCASSSISATLGRACDDRVHIELGESGLPVADRAAGDDLQALEQLGRAGTAVGLDQTHDHVRAALSPRRPSLSIAKVLPTPGAAPR